MWITTLKKKKHQQLKNVPLKYNSAFCSFELVNFLPSTLNNLFSNWSAYNFKNIESSGGGDGNKYFSLIFNISKHIQLKGYIRK